MRKAIFGAAILLVSLTVANAAEAKDWEQMNVDERLRWSDAYINQVCPHYPKSKPTTDQLEKLKTAPQWGVKMHIKLTCPTTTAQAK